ncbi:MAG: polysaccharide biosynthesis protein [Lachnospiraceae bacterium]|nr:polysaccharide biosynthesis protein [Lachnospiraceae bacterium]
MNTQASCANVSPAKATRISLLLIYDAAVVLISMYLAIWVRFDFELANIEPGFMENIRKLAPHSVLCTILIFIIIGLYKSLWSYASVREMMMIVNACLLSTMMLFLAKVTANLSLPRSYYILYFGFLIIGVGSSRFAYRAMRSALRRVENNPMCNRSNTLVIGAGNAGAMVVKELVESDYSQCRVKCIIDDDQNKWGRKIYGVTVLGGRDSIMYAVEKYDIEEIIIAIPSVAAHVKRDIVAICNETGCKIKILPGIYQIVNNEVSVSQLRKVEIEDLLGREPIRQRDDKVLSKVEGKTVLVTGGGGSIGSELCRQIANHNPKRLIIFDIYENNAYDIQQELLYRHPDMDLVVLIGSVRNTHRVDTLMVKYKPDIVYHAAAHKHVPLMEGSPNEAIKNNVIGTYNVARSAGDNKVGTFVLISTDKAVNSTNIMGASKRLCEKVIQSLDEEYKDTKYVAVRFGNVLGSNGSVIPLFKKQILAGGPVTVTHKDIIRYFMTIPEAVSLVLQAGTYAKGGEIFVLDMGDPVKIDELARNLIKLSGLKPDIDIKIEYTGLRPGEKLYEEKLMDEEGLEKTENSLIHIGKPVDFDKKKFLSEVLELKALAYDDYDDDAIYKKVKEMAPTFQWSPETKTDM